MDRRMLLHILKKILDHVQDQSLNLHVVERAIHNIYPNIFLKDKRLCAESLLYGNREIPQ